MWWAGFLFIINLQNCEIISLQNNFVNIVINNHLILLLKFKTYRYVTKFKEPVSFLYLFHVIWIIVTKNYLKCTVSWTNLLNCFEEWKRKRFSTL